MVLYTHQKLKKAKTWQDGFLKISSNGTKAVLSDEQGCSLEVFHIHSHKVFPGNDIECERYLISIGDEKISEQRIKNECSTGSTCILTDSANTALIYGVNNAQARKSNLGSTLGKRKRDVQDTFRPNLPRPRQDPDPGYRYQSFDSDPCNRKHPDAKFTFSTTPQNDFHLKKSDQETMINFNGPNEKKPNCLTRGTDFEYNSQNVPTSDIGANKFHPLKTYPGRMTNSKRQDTKESNWNNRGENINCMLSSSSGENIFLNPPIPLQEANYQNCFPTQKRNRSELLSLFGGKNCADRQKQPGSSNETIGPPKPAFLTSMDSENVYNKKRSTNSFLSEAFDLSLDDEEDFLDTSFQSLYKPRCKTTATSNKPPRLSNQPWRSDETEVIDVNVCHDEFADPEIDKVSSDYSNFKTNTFVPGTSRQNTLPWEAKVSQVKKDNSALIDKDFYQLDNGDFDDNYEEFGMFKTSSKTTRSLAGYNVEYKHQSCGTNNLSMNTSMNSNCTSSGRKQKSSQVGVGGNDLVNRCSDLEFKNAVLDYGECDDGPALLHPSSVRSSQLEAGERPNNMSSTSKSSFPTRSSLMRSSQFTPPLIASVDKNSRERNYKSSSVNEGVTVRSSIRPQSFSGELYFPSNTECCESVTPTRHVTIPTKFSSAMDYKSVLKSALREHLNIILFNVAQKYHGILSKADIASTGDVFSDQKENFKGPSCSHGPAKLRAVKKDGPNKGRHFYTCPGSGTNQCKFFLWADQSQTTCTSGTKKISLTSNDSIRTFFKSEGIYFYRNNLIERRSQPSKFFRKKHSRKASNIDSGKKVMYIVLKYRDNSSLYTKDDIWIISKTMNFEPRTTFVAKSSFYGPSSSGDLEIEPLSGYAPSNWRSGDTAHAVWACNAGTELSCIQNLDEHVSLQQMPLLPFILNGSHPSYSSQRYERRSFSAPLCGNIDRNSLGISWQVIQQETEKMVNLYNLNDDQAIALRTCAKMFVSESEENFGCLPITLIHGVFGAGKSFLLAVVVLLMVKLFDIANESDEAGTRSITWKILISSTTNVAVDRILLGLLELGFDQFVRVGSVKKIAKPVLPFSIHSIGTESQELKELQGLLKTELTSSEKAYVRKSIEMHKLGENRKRLADVRVVGVTCAACSFVALERLKFPVLLLDECSQMTEPTSLLPMARFGCRKLVLVGDPKQLNPTIQGSEPSHESGLEQTLFDRLLKMELKPILLRTQYRCHPAISSLSNRLFYSDQLLDGVTAEDRQPLVDFVSTLCFYNVNNGKEECSQDGSYFNSAEAKFVVVLIKSLLESDVEPKQIGVITQYKSQLTAIRNSLVADSETSSKELAGIQISTVDAFQGGEKDVIILSCVRTKHIGFIDCERRTNVALTRAKRHLCIVGCGKILSSNSLWSKILASCRAYPEGFQSSDSYIKSWNERRPMSDETATKSTSSKPKKPRKSRQGKTTSKLSDEAACNESSNVSAFDISSQIDTVLGSHSNSNSEEEVEEIFRSDPMIDYKEIDHEIMYSDSTAEISDDTLVVTNNIAEIANSDASNVFPSRDGFQNSHRNDWIEISDDNKSFDCDDACNVLGKGDGSDDQNAKKKERTIIEKQTDNSEGNFSDFMFGDDSINDDELCFLGL